MGQMFIPKKSGRTNPKLLMKRTSQWDALPPASKHLLQRPLRHIVAWQLQLPTRLRGRGAAARLPDVPGEVAVLEARVGLPNSGISGGFCGLGRITRITREI